ncbi:hypothetical protein CPC08DRAFT_756432 [Agrocybe pediades]|nr:hypothetical protein CPC08DRAFT_756432 [Agrocybe pediades]
MSSTESVKSAYVFVDDTDGDILYEGPQKNWLSTSQLHDQLGTSPFWYNTLHTTGGGSPTFLSYEFNGTFVSAHFASTAGEDVISNCTLDGKLLQTVFAQRSSEVDDSITCLPGKESTLGAGSHRFQAFSSGKPNLGFDGLFYVPIDLQSVERVVDLAYPVRRNLTMAGETFDFQFNGSAAALYTVYGVGGVDRPLNLSYSIDGGRSINWMPNTLPQGSGTITDYLLIQTSILSIGDESHSLHLELSTDNVLVPLQYVIVQNSGSTLDSDVNLAAVPTAPVTSSASITATFAGPSQTSSAGAPAQPHRPAHNTVTYISVSISVILILVLLSALIIKRQRMKRARSNLDMAPNASGMIIPFLDRPGMLQLTHNVLDLKYSRRNRVTNTEGRSTGKRGRNVEHRARAEAVGLASVENRALPPQIAQATPPAVIAPAIARTQPTYMIHEDAGSVRTTTPVAEDEVIELPPNYTSIQLSRHRRVSRAGDGGNGEDLEQLLSSQFASTPSFIDRFPESLVLVELPSFSLVAFQPFITTYDDHRISAASKNWVLSNFNDISTSTILTDLDLELALGGPFWYNTMHSASAPEALMSYVVNDGKLLQIFVSENSITCLPGEDLTLGAGNHKFQVFSGTNMDLQFDALFYVPPNKREALVDQVYPIRRNLTMAGDTFDFQFIGPQMALYTVYGVGGIEQPLNLSYSIDGGPSINWMVEAISQTKSIITDYPLIQTPILPLIDSDSGSHNLHLELKTDNVLVPLQYVIVQTASTTFNLNLTAVPPTSLKSSASISATFAGPSQMSSSAGRNRTSSSAGLSQTSSSAGIPPKHHQPGRNTIIYIAVPISAMLILAFLTAMLIRRQRKKRARSGLDNTQNASEMIIPFLQKVPFAENKSSGQSAGGSGGQLISYLIHVLCDASCDLSSPSLPLVVSVATSSLPRRCFLAVVAHCFDPLHHIVAQCALPLQDATAYTQCMPLATVPLLALLLT